MKLGVLDVGSNTVHMVVVDAHPGARPTPQASHKVLLRLMQFLERDGSISEAGIKALEEALNGGLEVAAKTGCEAVLPMATSALREATNGKEVLARLAENTGIKLQVLSGEEEAKLTFLAVRRWYGWSAGRFILFDIGGGSLEIATGDDESPDLAVSLPLGGSRMTKQFFTADPPPHSEVKALKQYSRKLLDPVVERFSKQPLPEFAVGTSKTFRSLGALIGTAGVDGHAAFDRHDLKDWVPRLEAMPSASRAALRGITKDRATQILAGAVVIRRALKAFEIERVKVCPWALREGVVLRYLDQLDGAGNVHEVVSSIR